MSKAPTAPSTSQPQRMQVNVEAAAPQTGRMTPEEAARILEERNKPPEQPEGEAPAVEEAEPEEALTTDDEDDTPEQDESLPKVRFKADGEWYEVDERQLVAFAQKGVNFTRKSQELAAEREKAAHMERVLLEREQEAARVLDEYAAQIMGGDELVEPNWEQIKREKPEDFPFLWTAHQQKQTELYRAAERRRALQESIDAKLEVERARAYSAELERLTTLIPEWKDPDVRKRGTAELRSYATEELGLDAAYVDSIADASTVLAFRKAMLYDRAQADKPNIQEKIENAKRVAPGAVQPVPRSRVQAIESRRKSLMKSGRLQDAVALLDELERK